MEIPEPRHPKSGAHCSDAKSAAGHADLLKLTTGVRL
jgi:hypothetical protein